MKYSELARKLQQLGCQEVSRHGSGSHRKWHNPITGRSVPIPDWGNKDLKPGTVRAIIRQLGISREDFGPIK
jgi:predicted RNA binding protein YcfA (HicA-like mRNA interferase family)